MGSRREEIELYVLFWAVSQSKEAHLNPSTPPKNAAEGSYDILECITNMGNHSGGEDIKEAFLNSAEFLSWPAK